VKPAVVDPAELQKDSRGQCEGALACFGCIVVYHGIFCFSIHIDQLKVLARGQHDAAVELESDSVGFGL
jgi:hypothetical protein